MMFVSITSTIVSCGHKTKALKLLSEKKSVKNVIPVIAKTWNVLSGSSRLGCVTLLLGELGYMFTHVMQPTAQIWSVLLLYLKSYHFGGPPNPLASSACSNCELHVATQKVDKNKRADYVMFKK